MSRIGRIVGIDAAHKRIWQQEARVPESRPEMMMPRLLGVQARKVLTRGILHVHADGTVHPCPAEKSDAKSGIIVAISCIQHDAEKMPFWWKVRGYQTDAESCAGKALVFGYTPGGKVVDCPLDQLWFQRFVEWGDDTPEPGEEAEANAPA